MCGLLKSAQKIKPTWESGFGNIKIETTCNATKASS